MGLNLKIMDNQDLIQRLEKWPLRLRPPNKLIFGDCFFCIEAIFYPEEVELVAKSSSYFRPIDTAYLDADASAEEVFKAVAYAANKYWGLQQ